MANYQGIMTQAEKFGLLTQNKFQGQWEGSCVINTYALAAHSDVAAGEGAESILVDIKRALLATSTAHLPSLMKNRKDDGSAPLQPDESLQEQLESAVKQLLPEKDEFGKAIPWQISFRRKKRLARQACSPEEQMAEGMRLEASHGSTCPMSIGKLETWDTPQAHLQIERHNITILSLSIYRTHA